MKGYKGKIKKKITIKLVGDADIIDHDGYNKKFGFRKR